MCELQSSVIHSSTTTGAGAGAALWDLAAHHAASSELGSWSPAPYQPHPLWGVAAAAEPPASPHPGHASSHASAPGYQASDLFGFGGEFWSGARAGAHGARQLLQYQVMPQSYIEEANNILLKRY